MRCFFLIHVDRNGFCNGNNKPVFAIATILAIIVMRDATSVRRETGKQAVVLNDLVNILNDKDVDITVEEKLKVFVGHTPLQVLFGSLLGIRTAVAAYTIIERRGRE